MELTEKPALDPQIIATLNTLAESWKAICDELGGLAAAPSKKKRAPGKRGKKHDTHAEP